MLIQSDFHDYYDSALGVTGVDTDIVYRRFTRTLDPADPPEGWFDSQELRRYFGRVTRYHPLWSSSSYGHSIVREFIVGFCGEAWYGMEIASGRAPTHNPFANSFVYDDEIGAFISEHIAPQVSRYDDDDPYNGFLDIRQRLWRYRNSGAIARLHRLHNVPVFVYLMGGPLLLNPPLKEFGFAKIKDVFSAFQNLQSYVGGVLNAPEPEMLEISELDRLKQHGFDEKWSFRNPGPPKRKQRKKDR